MPQSPVEHSQHKSVLRGFKVIVAAWHGTGGMADRLCIVCLGVRPHFCQTTRRWDAGLAAPRVAPISSAWPL